MLLNVSIIQRALTNCEEKNAELLKVSHLQSRGYFMHIKLNVKNFYIPLTLCIVTFVYGSQNQQ
jgi:hypothetical protein